MTSNRPRTRRTGLARALSKLGYCSRSEAFELIRAGRVRMNGRLVRDGEQPTQVGKDVVEVDGSQVDLAEQKYLMMNKPRGFLTTASDDKGRKTIYSLLPDHEQWVAPVGRLDMASEGLLLLTNDSAWGARIAAPESHIEKTYHVQIATLAGPELLERIKRGVPTDQGQFLTVKQVGVVRHGKKNSWLEIVLDEGKNRQIRRILGELGVEILRLIRVAIGPLELGDLPKGKTRELRRNEVQKLTAEVKREVLIAGRTKPSFSR